MKQARWKNILSYLYELHIESSGSPYNPELYVTLKNGRYRLNTANAIYSYDDLYDNYRLSFEKLELEELNPKKVLILGLGLGSIPYMLETTFNKKYEYTAVEIDEEVIYLANKYRLHDLQSSFEFVCTDALLYVKQCQQQFDLITIDLFLDDLVPKEFQAIEFLEDVKELLSPDGLIMFNRMAFTEADLLETETHYNQVFKKVFKDGSHIDVHENWMLINHTKFLKN